MPLSRYEIRNEYSLADPELYRGADKDDPEALLEGVAMAGLVGLLRQLGDLAEFAAETFHNLHEDVMLTAARGHSLMVRVQQLETEVPSIEKEFLSQTDHSSFLYNDGVDWRSNRQMDENLITRGDLPRFIMDSYEESRPPPRLFLLDKFDIAGAGACLKRYTDPSIFKVEMSGMTSTYVQRERKILRPKKKLSKWRDEQTTELLPTSHTKLHQLLSEEEHVELGVSKPSRRVKLKRRVNAFPLNSKTMKSYMEKLLTSPMSDDKLLVKLNSSATLMADRSDQSRLEVPEVRPVSPDRGNSWRKRSPPSPDREEMVLNPSTYAPTGNLADDKISAVPNSCCSFVALGSSQSTSDKMSSEKVIAVDAESSREGRTTCYESDSTTSEAENFVDAPLTMESDTDTEPKLRITNDFTSPLVKGPQQFSVAYEEHINYRSSDTLSIGRPIVSDDGNNSSRKEISSFSSHSRNTSAENPQPERYGKRFPSSDIPGTEITGALSHSTNQHATDFEQETSRLASDESISSSVHSDSAGVVTKYMLREPELDERTSTSSGNKNVTDLVKDTSYHPTVSDFKLQSGNDFARPSAGEHLKNEPNELDERASTSSGNENVTALVKDTSYHPTVSDFKLQSGNDFARPSAGEHLKNEPNAERVSSIYTASGNFVATESSITMPLDSRYGDESNREDGNWVENTNSRLNMPNVRSRRTSGTRKLSLSNYPIAGMTADKFPKLLENNPADLPYHRNNMTPIVTPEKSIVCTSDNSNSNSSVDASNHVSGMPFSSPGKKLKGMPWSNVRTADAEVKHPDTSTGNQTRSNNIVSPHLPISVDCLQNVHGADEEIIPEQMSGSSKSYVYLGLSGKGTVDDVSPNNSAALESSCHMLEKIDESVGRPDQFDMDGSSKHMSFSGQKITEFSVSAPKSPNDACVLLGGFDSDREKSLAVDLAYSELSGSQGADNVRTKVGIEGLEEHVHSPEHSGMDLPECDKGHLARVHGETSLVDEVLHANAAAEDFETVHQNSSNIDYPKSEVYESVCNSHLDCEDANDLQFSHATTDHSLGDQTGMGSEHVCCQQSHIENLVSDAMILPCDYGIEQSEAQQKIRIQPNQLIQDMLHSGKLNSELSMLPIYHQQMVDHVDHKGDDSSKFSLVDHSISVSDPEIQKDMDASGYPKETLDSILTPYGPSLGTNQINPPDQPALPPLPPMQWRIGRLQHASSSTEVEMKRKELSSQLVSRLTQVQWRTGKLPCASSTIEDNVKKLEKFSPRLISSTLSAPTYVFPSASLTVSADVANSSPAILPAADVSSSVEDSNHTVAGIASEERVENYGASLESKSDHGMVDLQPIIRSDLKQLVMPSAEGESSSTAEEELAHGSHTEQLPLPFDSIVNDDAGLDKSQPSDVTDQVKPQMHKVNERYLHSEQIRTKDAPELMDLHQMVKSKQQQFILPASRSEVPSLVEEDGAPCHSHTGELVEPCANFEDAIVLDNVSDAKESDWPPVQKVDERDLVSEHVGTKHMNERVDHPAEIESKQQVSVMPIPESNTLPLAEEIEVPHGSHPGKLAHPQDTLMEDDTGRGESKPSEVKEQVSPPVQEVEARDSVLKQMRTTDIETSNVQPQIQINPQQVVLPTPESEAVSPADENAAAHGSHTMKQRFPHNPLVEDISVLDKSKLRKVTDRVKSQVHRVDERDSLLEQIRTKSFNLRRAATSRPSIPGPSQTNINVAAILEKANAIRQAMAGSDEEEDSWSDS